jgi:ATP-dependent RNA helicase DDX51/DBP6
MITCSSSDKPLMLFHLVHTHNVRNALVFTKSAEATERLEKLFRFFEDSIATGNNDHEQKPVVVRSYSSDLSGSERKAILDSFKAQEIDV